MNQPNGTTCMTDRLFEPDDRLVRTLTFVFGLGGVFSNSRGVPSGCQGQDDEEGMDWSRNEREEGRVAQGVDVMELKIG